MVLPVKDRLIRTSSIELAYMFSPQAGYPDRGYGTVKLTRGVELISELFFGLENGSKPRSPKAEVDEKVLVIGEALANCSWLILGQSLTYEHFETQQMKGFIGEFRTEAPREYGEW